MMRLLRERGVSGRMIIGTRGSRLARVQAESVASMLREAFPEIEVILREIATSGDRDRTRSLSSMGKTGVFTREIERALLAGEIDLAVHSLKDLPVTSPEGLTIAATPMRADARDVLICRESTGLATLHRGAVVGTSSPRRRAQLLATRDDLTVCDLRGNFDTRLEKLARGDYDAIVTAAAALDRLGRAFAVAALRRHNHANAVIETLPVDAFTPAPGQGALAVQARDGDRDVIRFATVLNDATTFVATTAERMLLERLGGGCHLPFGALAECDADGGLTLHATVLSVDGKRIVRGEGRATMENPTDAVDNCYEGLLRDGASELLDQGQ